jgi:hypothetical protein
LPLLLAQQLMMVAMTAVAAFLVLVPVVLKCCQMPVHDGSKDQLLVAVLVLLVAVLVLLVVVVASLVLLAVALLVIHHELYQPLDASAFRQPQLLLGPQIR